MFYQFYRYHKKYHSQICCQDPRLRIVYPTDDHGMISAFHDFYVIGTFESIEVSETAVLTVELIRQEDGRVVRSVSACRRDNRQGMYVDYAGILSEDDKETIRRSGMPDLVYDPDNPESFWYTWNKAYYTEQVYAALIYGGDYAREQICQLDQNGNELEPLSPGCYELWVTLQNGGEQIRSAKTIMLMQGQREIILSRYSPEAHVKRVRRFALENGFEEFTDPYAGIWDTQYFNIQWPVKACIEIPDRWHWGDAREYQAGKVHFFDYNLSENCVGYQIELAGIVAADKNRVDNPDSMLTYYYRKGDPQEGKKETEELVVFPPGKYIAVTEAKLSADGNRLQVRAVCKALPVKPVCRSGCEYQFKNRIEVLDYRLFWGEEKEPFLCVTGKKTGLIRTTAEGVKEFLPLQVEHELEVPGPLRGENIVIELEARDCKEKVWDTERFCVPI